MPRDLEAEREKLPSLAVEGQHDRDGHADAEIKTTEEQDQRIVAIKQLHPYASLLGLGDLSSCLALEEATFPEGQRATRDKVSMLSGEMTAKVLPMLIQGKRYFTD